MKKILKRILQCILALLLLPVVYILVSLLLSYITVNNTKPETALADAVYLNSNGVHLDIIISVEHLSDALKKDIKINHSTKFLAFGWGDENFYLNTPTWGDLTFKNGFSALFLKSTALMHITRCTRKSDGWIAIKLSRSQLAMLNSVILETFILDENASKFILKNKGYTLDDDFYKAKGSYSVFSTCNTWVNSTFKKANLKACLWTPFDFTLLDKYR